MSIYSASTAAKAIRERFPRCEINARDVSEAVYKSRILRDLPLIAGRRLLSPDQLETLISELKRAGKVYGREVVISGV